jgi:hypothetical protein
MQILLVIALCLLILLAVSVWLCTITERTEPATEDLAGYCPTARYARQIKHSRRRKAMSPEQVEELVTRLARPFFIYRMACGDHRSPEGSAKRIRTAHEEIELIIAEVLGPDMAEGTSSVKRTIQVKESTVARLPSEQYLIQEIGGTVILFEDGSEREIVRFPADDGNAVAQAQKVIHDSELSPEDKCFAHFWSGYFYGFGACPAREVPEWARTSWPKAEPVFVRPRPEGWPDDDLAPPSALVVADADLEVLEHLKE